MGTLCCCKFQSPNKLETTQADTARTINTDVKVVDNKEEEVEETYGPFINRFEKKETVTALDLSILHSTEEPDLPRLYPPGRILHIVRKYPQRIIPSGRASTDRPLLAENSSKLVFQTLQKTSTTKNISGAQLNIKSMTLNSDSKNSDKNQKENKFNSRLIKSMFASSIKKRQPPRLSVDETSQQVPVYQVIENDNRKFNELLISPRMLQDHMPNNLIKCMRAVLDESAPKKPPRSSAKLLSASHLDEFDDRR